jgi:putative sigma-54 modulation protein
MLIRVMSKDLRITPDIEQAVGKKITQRLKKYSQRIDGDKHITVRASEKRPNTRVDIDVPYLNFNVHAEAVTTDGILGGVDKCMDILERQIEKFKSRINRSRIKSSKLKKEILKIVPDDQLISAEISEADDPAEEAAYKIIKVESKPKPMTIDEAVLQMEVLEYRFLVFFDIEADAASVIYKRDDGNIGLIEA